MPFIGGVLTGHRCPTCGCYFGSLCSNGCCYFCTPLFSGRSEAERRNRELERMQEQRELKSLSSTCFIQPIEKLPKPPGGDVHDTFKLDRYENTYGGHTTIRLPGGKEKHLSWEMACQKYF